MTNIAADSTFQYPNAIVDYASVMTLEVRNKMNGAAGHDGMFASVVSPRHPAGLIRYDHMIPSVRFAFRNGSDVPSVPISYKLFGSNSVDYDLATFISNLSVRWRISSLLGTSRFHY